MAAKAKKQAGNDVGAFVMAHKKAIAGVVLVLVVSAVAAHVTSGKAGAWRRQAATDQSQAATDDVAYKIGKSIERRAPQLRKEIAKAGTAVPVGEDQPSFSASLSALASKCAVTWSGSSWAVAPGAGSAGTTTWTVQVSLAGTASNVSCALNGLPVMPRAVDVTSVDLSYEAGNQVQANLSLEVYGRSSSSW